MLGRISVAGALLSWCTLLVVTMLPGAPSAGTTTALLLVSTGSAALACWCRALAPGRADRAVWALLAAGASAYCGAYAVLFLVSMGEGGGPFGLNYSDLVSLAFFPLCHAGVLLLTRRRVDAWDPRAVLDGAVVSLATAAAATAAAAHLMPDLFARQSLDALYATAYPIGTSTLVAAVLCGLVVVRFAMDEVWTLLLAAFVVMGAGQTVYAMRSSDGTFAFGTPLDAVYTAGPLLLALAAWARTDAAPRTRGSSSRTVMVLTAGATVLALVVLLDRDPRLPLPAVALAGLAVLAAVARTVLFLRQDELLELRTRQALTDGLTGLPNRRALLAHLAERLTGDLTGDRASTLLLVELQRVRGVNDALGRDAGDQLLQEVAARLLSAVPPEGLVVRLGGDEFGLVLPGGVEPSLRVAQRLQTLLERPVQLAGSEVVVGARCGLAAVCGEPTAGGALELLRRADVAMFRGRQAAGRVQVWDRAMDDAARDQLVLSADLRAALVDAGQLVVHLQLQCEPRTGRIETAEALVRWQHPTRGLLAPAAFLPVAESAGLLSALTTIVLETSLHHQALLRRAGHDVAIAVNIGASDLLDPRFPSRVAQALDRHGVVPGALRLEVTETVVLADPAKAARSLALLAGIGVGLSLDDYGTGLSSLTYLRELPVDELKIDRSFVTDLLTSRASRLITTSTVELAHALGLRVVAEGVEDEPTQQALAELGCDLVQGYHPGRPVPVEALLELLDSVRATSGQLPV